MVIGSLEVGGAETHLAQVLPGLVAVGFEVAVHTLTGRGALADRLEAGGVRVVVPDHAQAAARRGGFLARGLRAARACVSLARTMRVWRPDIVHFFLPEAYLVGAPVALLAGGRARLVMSRRSLAAYQAKRPLLARIERWLHGRMDAVIGNSDAIARELATEGVPPEKLRTIRNGIDLARFDRPQAGTGTPLTLLIVANLIGYKGHADLIDALALARDALPDWQLLCAGRDDGLEASLVARAAAAGIGKRVRFLGPREDVPALMATADVAVLASHEEGFPNAAIEAMAAGLPLVATRVGGVPEAAVDGETALLVPPRDPAALAHAIRRLAGDVELRHRLGMAGRERVHRHFGLDTCVLAYRDLYRGL